MSELSKLLGLQPLGNPVLRPTDHDGVFSPQEIEQANRRHDLAYGWSFNWPDHYVNSARLPETVVGKLDWD